MLADVLSQINGRKVAPNLAYSDPEMAEIALRNIGSGEMGARFGLEGWPEKVAHRNLRKVPKNSAPEPRGLEVQSRLQRGPRLPPPF